MVLSAVKCIALGAAQELLPFSWHKNFFFPGLFLAHFLASFFLQTLLGAHTTLQQRGEGRLGGAKTLPPPPSSFPPLYVPSKKRPLVSFFSPSPSLYPFGPPAWQRRNRDKQFAAAVNCF